MLVSSRIIDCNWNNPIIRKECHMQHHKNACPVACQMSFPEVLKMLMLMSSVHMEQI